MISGKPGTDHVFSSYCLPKRFTDALETLVCPRFLDSSSAYSLTAQISCFAIEYGIDVEGEVAQVIPPELRGEIDARHESQNNNARAKWA